jgi:hypothetical protein
VGLFGSEFRLLGGSDHHINESSNFAKFREFLSCFLGVFRSAELSCVVPYTTAGTWSDGVGLLYLEQSVF